MITKKVRVLSKIYAREIDQFFSSTKILRHLKLCVLKSTILELSLTINYGKAECKAPVPHVQGYSPESQVLAPQLMAWFVFCFCFKGDGVVLKTLVFHGA